MVLASLKSHWVHHILTQKLRFTSLLLIYMVFNISIIRCETSPHTSIPTIPVGFFGSLGRLLSFRKLHGLLGGLSEKFSAYMMLFWRVTRVHRSRPYCEKCVGNHHQLRLSNWTWMAFLETTMVTGYWVHQPQGRAVCPYAWSLQSLEPEIP